MMLAISNSMWAGAYVAGKVALKRVSFVELNAIRFAIASILMIPVLWSGRDILKREIRGSMRELVLLVSLGFVLNKGFEYAGLSLTTAVDVAILIAAESVFTAMLSWILLKEKPTASGVTALCVGAAGVYLVVARGLVPNLSGPSGLARIGGDLLVIAAVAFEAAYTVLGKAYLKRVPPLLFTAFSVAGCLFVWIPAASVAVWYGGMPHVTGHTMLAVLYLAAFATVGAYWLWFRGLSAIEASAAAPFLFLQPLLGAALGVVLLDESVTWATIAGAFLILTSLAIVTVSRPKSRDRITLALPE